MTKTKTEGAVFDLSLPDMKLPKPEVVSKNFKTAFDEIVGKVDEEIKATPVDISTKKGRDVLISLSAKISRTKVALDNRGKELAEPQKLITKAIDAERKAMREALEKRRDEVRAPVTAWENKEKERVAKSDAAFEYLHTWKSQTHSEVKVEDMDSKQIGAFNDHLLKTLLPGDPEIFGEDLEDYENLVNDKLLEIGVFQGNRKQDEADRAELAQLRAEREAREAREAEERAEVEEQERIARQREQLAAEERQKARAETEAAEQRAQQAEQDRIDAEKRAQEEAKRAAAEAERKQQEAVAAEKKRAENERLAQEEADRRRAADLENRNRVHKATVDELVKHADISEAQANRIITAIDDGKVLALRIQY